MKQTATIDIEIPDGNDWTVHDIEQALKKQKIKCNVTAVFNELKIPGWTKNAKRKTKERKKKKTTSNIH